MLKLKLQYFGYLMRRVDSLGKTLMLGGIGGRRRRGRDDRGWDGWMASLTRWTWVWMNSGSWWWTGRPGVLQFMGSHKSWTRLSDWTELNIYIYIKLWYCDIKNLENFFDNVKWIISHGRSCRGKKKKTFMKHTSDNGFSSIIKLKPYKNLLNLLRNNKRLKQTIEDIQKHTHDKMYYFISP